MAWILAEGACGKLKTTPTCSVGTTREAAIADGLALAASANARVAAGTLQQELQRRQLDDLSHCLPPMSGVANSSVRTASTATCQHVNRSAAVQSTVSQQWVWGRTWTLDAGDAQPMVVWSITTWKCGGVIS